jgi:uncharacterized RDD family membrane protein YckC
MNKDEYHVLQDRTAGFVTRMFAYIVDLVLLAGVVAIGGWVSLLIDSALESMGLDPRIDMGVIYLWSIPFIIGAYYVMFWSLTGRTVGKWFMGLKIVDKHGKTPSIGRSIIRFLGYGLSALAFWVGYAWVIIDDERRGWHDHMAKTWVVYDYARRASGEIYENYRDRIEAPHQHEFDESPTA